MDKQKNQTIHLLYLSQHRAVPGTDYRPEESTTSLCFGYYDEIQEEVENGSNSIDYQHSFALRYPSQFENKELTAKQIITLMEWQYTPILTPNAEATFGAPICCHTEGDDTPPFVGILLLSLNLLHNSEWMSLDKRLAQFAESFQELCQNIVSQNSTPTIGQLSKKAIVRSYRCANCADVCITVNTWRLQDIFLISKAIQLLTGQTVTIQTSPLWSMAAHTAYVSRILTDPDIIPENADVTIDFHIDILDTSLEKEFLAIVPEKPNGKSLANSVERVGGVLGTGNYSVHLPFSDYWRVIRAKLSNSASDQVEQSDSPLMAFLIKYISSKQLDIRNQRIRFCYQGDVLAHIHEFLAGKNLPQQRQSAYALSPVEKQIQQLLKELSAARNRLPEYEYPYREALARVMDLVYQFNDFLYSGNIHSYIFASQLLAMLGGIKRYLDYLDVLNQHKPTPYMLVPPNKHLIDQYSAAMIRDINNATIAIGEYSHALVVFSRNHIHSQNYGTHSKINIEKYLIAYSAFLHEICDNFNRDRSPTEQVHLLPFCYLDKHQKKILVRTLFRWTKVSEDVIPAPLPVACPNYRSFANAYRLLPLLTHEVSHQFRYLQRDIRNAFVMEQVWEHFAEVITKELLKEVLGRESEITIGKDIQSILAFTLQSDFKERFGDQLSDVAFRELSSRILQPYVSELLTSFGYKQLETSVLQPGNIQKLMRKFMEYIDIPKLQHEQARGILNKYQPSRRKKGSGNIAEYGYDVTLLLCSSAAFQFFSAPGETEQNYKWKALLEDAEAFCDLYPNAEDRKVWRTMFRWLASVLGTYSLEKPDFSVGIFRNIVAQLLIASQDKLLREKYHWLSDVWMGKEALKAQQDHSAGDAVPFDTVLFDFWSLYYQIVTNLDADNVLKGTETLRSYADRLLGVNGVAVHNVGLRDKLMLKEPASGISQAAYTSHLIDSFLLDLQALLECYEPLMHSFGDLSVATLANQNPTSIVKKLAAALAQSCQDNLLNHHVYSTTKQRLLQILQEEDNVFSLLQGVINCHPRHWWVRKGEEYIDLYSEICADLGMCSAYKLDEIGYLALTANQYIKELKEGPWEDASFNFRDQRYQIVLDVLMIQRQPADQRDYHMRERQILTEQIHMRAAAIFEQLTTMLVSLVRECREYNLPPIFLESIRACLGISMAALPAVSEENSIQSIFHCAAAMIAHMDRILTILREYVAGEENDANVNNLRERIRILTGYQSHLHVLRYITHSISYSKVFKRQVISTPNKEKQLKHFSSVMDKIQEENWIKCMQKDSFYSSIGEYYRNWGMDVCQPCSLSQQLQFVSRYYSLAHKRYYIPLDDQSAEFEPENLMEEWFRRFFYPAP